jgi:uncharacterized membrane protein
MKWTHYLVIFLGFWLIASPATFGYASDPLFCNNSILCGFLAVAFGIYTLTRLKVWASWMLSFIGLWLQFAPLLFWAKDPVIYLNDTLIGLLLIAFSLIIPRLPYEDSDNSPGIPIGWSHNPSTWTQRIPIIALACFCWFLARYLAAFQLGYYPTVWDPLFEDGTFQVLRSKVSKAFPISDAGLGALSYTVEAILGCVGGEKRWRTMPWLVLLFGILVVPVGIISILLVILQPVVVGAWCTICLFTSLGMLFMVVLTLNEVVASLQFLRWNRKKGHPFWRTFWKGGTIPQGPIRKQSEDHILLAVTPTINLFLTSLIGIVLMFSPSYFELKGHFSNLIHVIGALTAANSIIAMAEVARIARFLNVFFGSCLLLSVLFHPTLPYPALSCLASLSVALILLSFRRGPIEERYGSYHPEKL